VRIVIQPSAVRDLREGFRFYEEKETGLGSYFLDSLSTDIESLQLYAGIHSIHFGRFRLLSKRFPYAAYYQTEGEVVLIRAIFGSPPRSQMDRPKTQRIGLVQANDARPLH
jgi:plasmid stabilization system protein ParE